MYLVYESASGQPLFTQKLEPGVPPDFAFIEIDDETALAAGDKVVDGAFVPYVPTLADAQTLKVLAAEAQLGTLFAAGFTWSGSLYQIDTDSQTRITAMGALAFASMIDPTTSPWDSGFYWVAADNSHVPMDAAATYTFARAVALYVSGCILHLRTIKDGIAGAADQAALDAIDVTAGYPAATA